jgi:hypothetical protein
MPRSYTRRPGARPPGRPKDPHSKSTHVRLPIGLYKRVRRVAALRGIDHGSAVQLLVEKSIGVDPLTRMAEVCALLGRYRDPLRELLEVEGQDPGAVDAAIDTLTVVARVWHRADLQAVGDRLPDREALGGER